MGVIEVKFQEIVVQNSKASYLGSQASVLIEQNLWEEMGKPDTLTLTLEVGDTLNE